MGLTARPKKPFILPMHLCNIKVISRSAFLKGVITQSSLPEELVGSNSSYEKLHQLAMKYDVSPAKLALSFVLSKPEIATTIIGVNSIEELTSNIDSLHIDGVMRKELKGLRMDNENLIDPRRWKTI